MTTVNYGLSFIEGVLTFISPCMLPMLPVYLFYLAGVAGEERQEPGPSPSRRGSGLPLLRNAAAFVAGFTVIFVSLGAVATVVGAFLNAHLAVFRVIGGLLMILFGLGFAGVLRLRFLEAERRLPFRTGKLTFIRSLIFGAVFAFGWTPCVGYLLSSSLLMAGSSDSVLQGMLLLLLYSLGLGLPFLFSSLIYNELKETFRFLQRHNRLIGILSGAVMITAGILTLTDRMQWLANLR
ncbi:cytochrome c-type biogenesis protein [Paenibacillus forsythiae]|uniref:Cytochrome c-type biogenesis protein n=1 Tax=Paenibacillus forsythiae TaxID=365616 RepID=A0ABU3HB73_9BACL|nr:cytochrome c biogenesis protein CcdA [Paenibacillus forsythiae]MDT3428077.1 cytochrome c-type biogenesis protein [Paenibacillus forsythiae]